MNTEVKRVDADTIYVVIKDDHITVIWLILQSDGTYSIPQMASPVPLAEQLGLYGTAYSIASAMVFARIDFRGRQRTFDEFFHYLFSTYHNPAPSNA